MELIEKFIGFLMKRRVEDSLYCDEIDFLI